MPSRKPTSYGLRQAVASMVAQAVSETTASSRADLITARTSPAPALFRWLRPLAPGVDAGGFREVAVDARHALDLALGGKALVEPFLAELLRHFRPRREAALPAGEAAGFRLGVLARDVGAYAHHRLDGDGLGDHVAFLAPHRLAEHGARRLEEDADDGVVARHLLRAAAGELDRAPAPAHPAVQLVEELRLQHPLVALAAPAEAVDAVAQRAVALAIHLLHQARGELAVGPGERHAVVQVDEVALVDAR